MRPMIQALESRVLFSATPSQAVVDAVAKVAADKTQIQTDLAAFHAGIGAANSAFATARAAAQAAIKQALGNSSLSQLIGGLVDSVLAADRQALKDAVTAHTTALKSNLAAWNAAHAADLVTLHTDIAALHAAIKASH
jgi:hypothetical protein